MGLELGQEQVRIEKRLGNIFIRRDLESGAVSVSVEGVIGFYDADGRWHNVRSETVELTGDAITLMLGITPDKVGNPQRLGDFLGTVAYGVLSGHIPTNAVLTANVTSSDGTPIPANITVFKNGVMYGSGTTGQPIYLPVLLGATVMVSSEGYMPKEVQVPVLAGPLDLDVALEQLAAE